MVSFRLQKKSCGTLRELGDGDRICSDHFLSGWKSESPGSPDYMPSVYPHQVLKVGTGDIGPQVSWFERTQQRARMAAVRDWSEQEERQWLLHKQQADLSVRLTTGLHVSTLGSRHWIHSYLSLTMLSPRQRVWRHGLAAKQRSRMFMESKGKSMFL